MFKMNLKSLQYNQLSQEGFGLIEVLVATAILSIVAVGSISLIQGGLKSNKNIATDTQRNSLHNQIKSTLMYSKTCSDSLVKNINLKTINLNTPLSIELNIADMSIKNDAHITDSNIYVETLNVKNLRLADTSNVTLESFFIGDLYIKEKVLNTDSGQYLARQEVSLGSIHFVAAADGKILKCSSSGFEVLKNTANNVNSNLSNLQNTQNNIINNLQNQLPAGSIPLSQIVSESSTQCQSDLNCIVQNFVSRNNLPPDTYTSFIATPDWKDRVSDYKTIIDGVNKIQGTNGGALVGDPVIDKYITSGIQAGRSDIGTIANGVAVGIQTVGVDQVAQFINENPTTWEQGATLVSHNGGLDGVVAQADLGTIWNAVQGAGITQEQVDQFFANGGTMQQALEMAKANGY